MPDVVATLGGGQARQTRTQEGPERVDGATAGRTDNRFECGEAELDGVDVGAGGRQEPPCRAAGCHGGVHLLDRVGRESVRDHDVPGLEGRHEDLFDVGEETGPVHRAIQDPGRGESRHPQRGDEGAALPSTLGGVVGDPLAAKSAPIPPEEIGGDPALIQKDEGGRVEGRGRRCPLRARGREVGAVVFGRASRFLYG